MLEFFHWRDWDTLAYWVAAIATVFLVFIALKAKKEWTNEHILEKQQKLFESLIHIINWLNDLYAFAIDPKLYHGINWRNKNFMESHYDEKKEFIIAGCQGAFEGFNKVHLGTSTIYINIGTIKEIKEYVKELEKIFDDLKQESTETGELIKRNEDERPDYLKTTDFDKNSKLLEIINLLRKDLGLKELK